MRCRVWLALVATLAGSPVPSGLDGVGAADVVRAVGRTHAIDVVPDFSRAGSSDLLASLRLVDLDGRTWTAADLRGRVILIDVWATWCAPCLTELPYLKRLRAAYPRGDFEILGVSIDVSDRRTFVSWINRQGIRWPQVFDGRGRTGPSARQLRIVGVPTSYLFDRDGRFVGTNLRGERLLAAVDRLVRVESSIP